jgi:branched-chain amino acid transport system substrate-binding protein
MKTVVAWLVAAMVFAAAICERAEAQKTDEGPVKVGVVLPLTGPHAKFGEIEKNSFLLGLEQINANGGVKGMPVELVFEDDGSKFDRGRAAAEKLIVQQRVIALTGGYSSSVSFAVASVAQRWGIPFLVTTGSADEITEQGWDYVFRICQPVSEYSKALIDFLQEVVKPQRVAIIYENSMFGQAAAKEFTDQVVDIGWKIVLSGSYEPETTDFKPLLQSAKQPTRMCCTWFAMSTKPLNL